MQFASQLLFTACVISQSCVLVCSLEAAESASMTLCMLGQLFQACLGQLGYVVGCRQTVVPSLLLMGDGEL